MFEAREFLRKKLIGQNVKVFVDYVQLANNDFPEKTCCTVTIGGVNVAEALVSRGLATVVRYAADNDQRSSKYDDLLSAEDKAKKSSKGEIISFAFTYLSTFAFADFESCSSHFL